MWKEEHIISDSSNNATSNNNVSAQLLAYRQRHQQHFYQQQKNYFNFYRNSGSAVLKSISSKDDLLPIICFPNESDSLLQYNVVDLLYVPTLVFMFPFVFHEF